MKLVVGAPHFAPDVAPTGEVITKHRRAAGGRGHRIDVITSLPWYEHHARRAGLDAAGRPVRVDVVGDGHTGAPVPDRQAQHPAASARLRRLQRARRAASGLVGGKVDGVLAMSPPLTLGPDRVGMATAAARSARVQHPGRLPGRGRRARRAHDGRVIAAATLARAGQLPHAPTPSRCCPTTCATTWPPSCRRPSGQQGAGDPELRGHRADPPRRPENAYRRELGLDGKTVVMYAGNVGLVAVARAHARRGRRALAHDPRGRVRDQRRRLGAPGPRAPRAAGCPTSASSTMQPRGPAARGAGRRPTSTSCR